MELCPDNIYREECFSLIKSWKAHICTLKEWKSTLSKEKWPTPSWFDCPTNCLFLGHLPYSTCKSVFHVFPFPTSGTSTDKLHSSSHWLTHMSAPATSWSYILFHSLVPCTLPWRWRQQYPLKCWYSPTTLHGITIQKTLTWIFTLGKPQILRKGMFSRSFRTFVYISMSWFSISTKLASKNQSMLTCTI